MGAFVSSPLLYDTLASTLVTPTAAPYGNVNYFSGVRRTGMRNVSKQKQNSQGSTISKRFLELRPTSSEHVAIPISTNCPLHRTQIC